MKSQHLSKDTSVVEKKKLVENAAKKITILIAEDEEYNMLYMNELFSNSKFEIIEASNGKKAVEMAKKQDVIDLILMDIKMPLMDGNEAMREIKKFRPELPIIALTAFAMESDKNAAINKGFNAYLTKPIDRKLLFELITNYTN